MEKEIYYRDREIIHSNMFCFLVVLFLYMLFLNNVYTSCLNVTKAERGAMHTLGVASQVDATAFFFWDAVVEVSGPSVPCSSRPDSWCPPRVDRRASHAGGGGGALAACFSFDKDRVRNLHW